MARAKRLDNEDDNGAVGATDEQENDQENGDTSTENGATGTEPAPAPEGYQHVVVLKKLFLIRAPYHEGHVCNANEANALNQLRKENIRNNWSTKMKTAAEKEGRELTQEDLDAYDASYEMNVRAARPERVIDPVEAEHRKLCESRIRDAMKARGIKLKNLTEAEKQTFDATVQRLMASGKFLPQAQAIVAAKSNVVELTQEELDLVDAA